MTIDKTKLRELATAALAESEKHGEEGWFDANFLFECVGISMADGRLVEETTPAAILTLLDELQDMTEERDSLMDDALKFAAQHDELKRTAKEFIAAAGGEVRESPSAVGFSSKEQEERYIKANHAARAAFFALRKAIES